MREQPAEPASAARHTVLYIEDNPANVRLVQRVFEHRGDIELLTAEHGAAGIELARRHRPAVVLLDLHLPDLDGFEVLHMIRSDPLIRATPIVIVSADAFDAQIQRLLLAGASAYLTKPLDLRRLIEIVEELIDEQRRPGDPPRRPTAPHESPDGDICTNRPCVGRTSSPTQRVQVHGDPPADRPNTAS